MPSKDEEIAGLQAELAESRRKLRAKNEKIRELRGRPSRPGMGRHLAPLPYSETPVFFLVGRGRSGTTWLQEVLNSHPEILCRGEGYLFDRNFRWDEFRDLHPRLMPASLYNAIAGDEYLRLWAERSVWAVGETPDRHLDNLTRIAVNYFMGRRLARENARLARGGGESTKRIVGDKTPFVGGKVLYEMNAPHGDDHRTGNGGLLYSGAEILEEAARVYPEARTIHIIRDGRDVAASVMRFMWERPKGEEGGIYGLEPEEIERRDRYREDPSSVLASDGLFTEKRLRAIARGWAKEVAQVAERGPEVLGDRYAEVRYEALIARPAGELGRLLAFLGADASEDAAKGCVELAGSGRLSRVGTRGWQAVFTGRDRRVFKEEAGDLLVKLGYERDTAW